MHILLIHQAFAALDEPGGTRHFELARYLAAAGYRVTVIASPVSYLTGKAEAQPNEATIEGVHIYRAYTYAGWHRSFVHRVFSFLSFMISSFVIGLRVQEVDVVWGTSPPIFQAGTAWALARIKRAAFLFEVRDLWPAFAVGVGVLRHRLLIIMSEIFEHFLYRHADQIIVNSPGFIDHVTKGGGKHIALVPNGADAEMFTAAGGGQDLRKQYGLDRKFVALYAGAHGMSNDLHVILDAAQSLQSDPEMMIVLLGDGKEKPALMQEANRRGLQNVLFLPPLPKTEMPKALGMADVCIAILKPIPLYRTVYPNKVFDYMAAGKAVVLMIDGVIRDVVEEAQAGVFCPPGDAAALAGVLRELKQDARRVKRMGENGRQCVARRFDRAILASQMEEILKTLN